MVIKQTGIFEGVSLDSIDIVRGIERFGNELTYVNVLHAFHLHTQPLLEKIKAFSGKKTVISLSDYATIVHGIKGSSSGIFADTVAAEAAELEKAAKAGDLELVMTRNSFFITIVESLLSDLGELLKNASAGKEEKKYTHSPDSVLLSRLLEASNEYKANLMEQVIQELESYEYEAGGGLVVWLREQMDNLEYDAIRNQLDAPDPFNF